MRTLSISVSDYRVTDSGEIVPVGSPEPSSAEYDAVLRMIEYMSWNPHYVSDVFELTDSRIKLTYETNLTHMLDVTNTPSRHDYGWLYVIEVAPGTDYGASLSRLCDEISSKHRGIIAESITDQWASTRLVRR
jgi:hypothetical protein